MCPLPRLSLACRLLGVWPIARLLQVLIGELVAKAVGHFWVLVGPKLSVLLRCGRGFRHLCRSRSLSFQQRS
eukprot:5773187-Amphidinium_carterae.2